MAGPFQAHGVMTTVKGWYPAAADSVSRPTLHGQDQTRSLGTGLGRLPARARRTTVQAHGTLRMELTPLAGCGPVKQRGPLQRRHGTLLAVVAHAGTTCHGARAIGCIDVGCNN
jgi:hypothetical protein